MKRTGFLLLLICALAGKIAAQTAAFDLAAVPDSLKNKANVIKRSEEINVEVDDVEQSVVNVHQVLTVLNERGKSALVFSQYTSKVVLLPEAEIKVYDANGKQTARYRKKDMTTVPTGEGLIEDGYITFFTVSTPSYPVTVEYNYTLRIKGTMTLPSYDINDPVQSVVSSTFTVKAPKDFPLRYLSRNIQLEPQITEDEKSKFYKWTVTNMPAYEVEPGCSKESRDPHVLIAPNRFSFYGHVGDLSSWKAFGQWLNDLYGGLDALPEDRKAFFMDLVKNATSDREKAKIIYDYLQKNFRYVSIQLGIGGWKPFPADFTDKKKYGDCKGLSNFMKAALNAVGVKSYLAVINAYYNSEPVNADFPGNHGFNHMILCIPQPKDSIWLECTSPITDFGILGDFTENRYALLITEQGGALVRTPVSKYSDNLFSTVTTVALNEDGSGQTASTINTTGHYRELLYQVMNENDDDKKRFIVNGMGARQPDEFTMQKKEQQGLHMFVSLNMSIEKIPAFMAGSKMFLAPRVYKVWADELPRSENRKRDFYFHNPFDRTDTTIFKLPAGYVTETLPETKTFTCPYGNYTTRYWFNEAEHAVYSTARLQLLEYRIPAAGYAAVKKFFDNIILEEAQRIVIKKAS